MTWAHMGVADDLTTQGKKFHGADRPGAVSVELEVPFHDVDAMGLVWHGHYYKYLELARTALFRARGLDIGSLIGRRFRFVMIESGCRYTAPLHYGDRVQVSAWLRDLKHRIYIQYEAINLTSGKRVARAHTVLASTDRSGRMLLQTPDEIIKSLDQVDEGRA